MRTLIRQLLSRGFTAIMLSAALTEGAAGTTYYVRKTGNNSNTGTSPTTAFLTVDKAANVALAGDTVYVGAGVYNESASPGHDGTAVAPIAFIADIDGSHTGDAGNVDITKSGNTAFNIGGKDYIQLIGFRLRNSNFGVGFGSSTGSVISNCEIYGNANDGVRCNGSTGISINNCILYGNTDYGIDVQGNCTVTLTGCTLRNNNHGFHAEDAGSSPTLLQCRIYSNTLRGAFCRRGTTTLKNCLIYANGSEGIYAETNGPTITVWNCTVSDNVLDGVYQRAGTVTITNSILAFNGAAGIHYTAGTLTHTYNVLYGNTGGPYNGAAGSTGELTSDPIFANRAAGDYHLSGGSSAINHGANASGIVNNDLDGNARPIGPAWDMGAYESIWGAAAAIRVTQWLEIP